MSNYRDLSITELYNLYRSKAILYNTKVEKVIEKEHRKFNYNEELQMRNDKNDIDLLLSIFEDKCDNHINNITIRSINKNLDKKEIAEKINDYKNIINDYNTRSKLNIYDKFKIKEANKYINIYEAFYNDEQRSINNDFVNNIKIKNNDNNKMYNNKFNLISEVRNLIQNNIPSEKLAEINSKGAKQLQNIGVASRGNILLPFDVENRADIMATVEGQGQELIGKDIYSLQLAVRNRNVLKQAGANYLTTLTRDLSIPTYSGSNVGFINETGSAINAFSNFTELTFKPNRISGYIDISRQFIVQENPENEKILVQDLSNAINSCLESAILSNLSGNSINDIVYQPAGLFYGKTIDISGSTIWENICKMEHQIDINNTNSDNMSYLLHPDVNLKAKTTVKTGSQEYIRAGKLLNDYNCLTTANMPDISGLKGCIFGNFNDLWIAQFGAIDLTVDPYTQAVNGKVRIVINAYFDWKLRNDKSLVFAKLN